MGVPISSRLYCNYNKIGHRPTENEIAKPVIFPAKKFSIDLVDFGSYNNENVRYILTWMDVFSRYLDFAPIKDKQAETVAKEVVLLAIKYNAFDAELLFDNGLEFKNQFLTKIADEHGLNLSHISPRNPRSLNVERAHKELHAKMRIQKVKKDNMLFHIRLAIEQINHLPNAGLNNLTPFEVYTGQASTIGIMYHQMAPEEDPDFSLVAPVKSKEWVA